jgi:hypothetical protein
MCMQHWVSFWGVRFPSCQQAPLKKGNTQMYSSVQDNPAAPILCQYILKKTLEFSTRVAQ